MAKSLPPSSPTTPLDTANGYPHCHRRSQQMLRAISYFFFNLDINHATATRVIKSSKKMGPEATFRRITQVSLHREDTIN